MRERGGGVGGIIKNCGEFDKIYKVLSCLFDWLSVG